MRTERRWYNRTELRDTLVIDYNTVLECLAYLLSENMIELRVGDTLEYRWKRK